MCRKLFPFLILVAFLLQPATVHAQQSQLPLYVVQTGDTLTIIASRFGITVNELLSVNNISDPNAIQVGMELSIPGLDGITGKLTNTTVGLGDSLLGFSLRNQLPEQILEKINRITSPNEIFTGTELIVPISTEQYQPRSVLDADQSTLEQAILSKQNPWAVMNSNHWGHSWSGISGDLVFQKVEKDAVEVNPISPKILSISLSPLPLTQGSTTEIKIKTSEKINFTGSLSDLNLNFSPVGDLEYAALTGIDAQTPTGLVSFTLHGVLENGTPIDFQQPILLQPGYYGSEQYLTVNEDLIDPKTIDAENSQILPITKIFNPEKYYSSPFKYPIDEPCINGGFGSPRLYNGTYQYYHTGVDFAVCASNINIYAAAKGTVVFTGLLPIKGNYTIIDHGLGVYTGYAHQSKFLVSVNDKVEAGQKIGEIGSTGRSVGPHLHFDLWINSVYVNPMDWFDKSYP
jgi:murein DD-endopeptidase MepM/ murein hydrolase activator NlpD